MQQSTAQDIDKLYSENKETEHQIAIFEQLIADEEEKIDEIKVECDKIASEVVGLKSEHQKQHKERYWLLKRIRQLEA